MLDFTHFFDGYRAAAAFVGPADGDGGFEGVWTDEAMESMKIDCENFVAVNLVMLNDAVAIPGYDSAAAGHDFFLTRNRHGAGYWDRGLGKIGNVLTSAAHDEGEATILVDEFGQWDHLSESSK